LYYKNVAKCVMGLDKLGVKLERYIILGFAAAPQKSELEEQDVADESATVSSSAASPSKSTTKTKTRTKSALDRKVFVWLPLTFPEVPKKGDFDVKRVRESRYFFH